MIPINKVTSDSACRTFLSNDVSFASFINAVVFEGEQLIHPENLVYYENDTAFIINDLKRAEDKKRRRDIVVKSDINGIYCILGVGHQSSVDQAMVVRCAIYEMLEYLKQLENKEYKRLVPQIMVAFYTGPKKWNVPVKLSDYFEIPEELKKYFNDWKIILVDVKEMDTSKIKDEQTRYFIEAIQAMYKGDYIKLHQKRKMNTNNLIYAAIITGSLDMIKDIVEGDEMDMCEGMERMAEGFRSEGREEGILVGRNEGKLEEKQNMLNELLKVKLGSLSSNLEKQLSNTSIEKLNVLTRHIFNVNNEDDVLRIIH
ncbi:Rpn family recombination-promoting nuclease/putative transposase [Faecalibacillus intestinalis]|uniref:Rpn family recombination-promoting nuclease/putative transposase n=1 Tax=Faecalibacillus intestinalis TaxID=1982626 RepID=UPI003522ED0E